MAVASVGLCARICTSLQTDNHTNTSSLNFYRLDTLPDAQTTVSKHSRAFIWYIVSRWISREQHAASILCCGSRYEGQRRLICHLMLWRVFSAEAVWLVVIKMNFLCIEWRKFNFKMYSKIVQPTQPTNQPIILQPLYRSICVSRHRILLVQCCTARMPLLMANSAFKLGRRRSSSP